MTFVSSVLAARLTLLHVAYSLVIKENISTYLEKVTFLCMSYLGPAMAAKNITFKAKIYFCMFLEAHLHPKKIIFLRFFYK